jgi:hypothetical protein
MIGVSKIEEDMAGLVSSGRYHMSKREGGVEEGREGGS